MIDDSSIDVLRSIVQDGIAKTMYSTSIFMAEKLTLLPQAVSSDFLLYAQCFFLNGERRRCLTVLEQRGFLSAREIKSIAEVVHSTDFIARIKCSKDELCSLEALHLAAQALFSLEQYEDCCSLLDPLVVIKDESLSCVETDVSRIQQLCSPNNKALNVMAGIYLLVGKSMDYLDKKSMATRVLKIAVFIDAACTEALEYLMDNSMLSSQEKLSLYNSLVRIIGSRDWLLAYYALHLLPSDKELHATIYETAETTGNKMLPFVRLFTSRRGRPTNRDNLSMTDLLTQSEFCYSVHQFHEAYSFARQAYVTDPYNSRALLLYIACLVELQLKTELFYLGHALVESQSELGWYCVGCYYWVCAQYELAKKYLKKATKLNRKLFHAWILFGHVLAAQEESEQAISIYRSAMRLFPGDHRPMVYMAKELSKTNFLPLALHILLIALEMSPNDPGMLNELGVIYLKIGNIELAVEHFCLSIRGLENVNATSGLDENQREKMFLKVNYGIEILSNYATALRKSNRLSEALFWFEQCLALEPTDSNNYLNIAFTLHLMRRFDDAITAYHKTLSLHPNSSFCTEMLNRAFTDALLFASV